ncbi:MAG TPA: hypothetical protein VNA89_01390 [Gemmatimonadaceae bacterium]|nr:hypothetical protein [Gemmatimonadaceae bacterium]
MSPMDMRERVRVGVWSGAVAAAAVVGALVGIGWRAGVPSRPFNAIAVLLLRGRAEGVWGFDAVVTPAGAVVTLGTVFLLGIIFSLIAAPWRGLRLLIAGVAVSAAAYGATRAALAPLLQPTLAAALTPAQLALACVVLAVALVAGIRLAR